MRVWSDEILGNDLAADVAGAYQDATASGASVESAVKIILSSFAEPMRDAGDRRIVWIALAAAQRGAGTVTDEVRANALKAIAWCESPKRDPDDLPFGLDAIAKLRTALGDEPSARKSVKAVKPARPPGNGGEVVVVSLPNDGGEAVLFVAGPSAKITSPDTARVVWLFDLSADSVTADSVDDALKAWRNYRQVWANGLGRRIGCYDLKGSLPARRTRVLLRDVAMPGEFKRRMMSFGELHKSADLPWVVEHDVNDWKSAKWAVDPEVRA